MIYVDKDVLVIRQCAESEPGSKFGYPSCKREKNTLIGFKTNMGKFEGWHKAYRLLLDKKATTS